MELHMHIQNWCILRRLSFEVETCNASVILDQVDKSGMCCACPLFPYDTAAAAGSSMHQRQHLYQSYVHFLLHCWFATSVEKINSTVHCMFTYYTIGWHHSDGREGELTLELVIALSAHQTMLGIECLVILQADSQKDMVTARVKISKRHAQGVNTHRHCARPSTCRPLWIWDSEGIVKRFPCDTAL